MFAFLRKLFFIFALKYRPKRCKINHYKKLRLNVLNIASVVLRWHFLFFIFGWFHLIFLCLITWLNFLPLKIFRYHFNANAQRIISSICPEFASERQSRTCIYGTGTRVCVCAKWQQTNADVYEYAFWQHCLCTSSAPRFTRRVAVFDRTCVYAQLTFQPNSVHPQIFLLSCLWTGKPNECMPRCIATRFHYSYICHLFSNRSWYGSPFLVNGNNELDVSHH